MNGALLLMKLHFCRLHSIYLKKPEMVQESSRHKSIIRKDGGTLDFLTRHVSWRVSWLVLMKLFRYLGSPSALFIGISYHPTLISKFPTSPFGKL